MKQIVDSPLADESPDGRRSFLRRLSATVIGAIVVLFPLGAGLGVLLHPLLRRGGHRGNRSDGADDLHFVRVVSLDALPDDGLPRQFALTADVVDAWTRVSGRRVGSVFLSRTDASDGPQVQALSSVCPHLGCAVDFNAADDVYQCPCHASAFGPDGQKLYGPSLRGLDPLPTKIVDHGDQQEVWVAPERFRTGIAERIPIG